METNALEQSAHERDLAPLFGDLSQSEKLSEIKPSLNQDKLVELLCLHLIRNKLPYARHYNPRFVYFLPTF